MPDPDRHPAPLRVTNRVPAVGTPGARPMGEIPVLARFVLDDGTETWRIAIANRWTQNQVLVVWRNDPANPYSSQTCWLDSSDVTRVVTGSAAALTPIWESLPRGQW